MITVQISKQEFHRFKFYGYNKVLVHINEQEDGDIITCDELMIPCHNKDIIVSSLIKVNYSADKMDAVRNNYELVRDGTAGDKEEEYTAEYLAMQEWRAYCKELAIAILKQRKSKN